jgi:hypothetical protein
VPFDNKSISSKVDLNLVSTCDIGCRLFHRKDRREKSDRRMEKNA